MCEECLSPHGQRRAGQKGRIRQWTALSPPVPNSIGPLLFPISNRPSSPVWFGMMHCSPSLALIMKCLFFTKLPLTEKHYFLFFFLLLVSAFVFFQKRNINLKIILRDFRSGTVAKNPPAKAGDTGSIPGLGRSHMPRGQLKPVRHNYWAHTLEPGSCNYWAQVLQSLKPTCLV